MILRDPVHGLVAFEGPFERVIMALLDTREVQRLRRVRQLGLTSLVFPGAEHSRFAHALGAAYVMVRLLDRMDASQNELPQHLRLDDEARCDAVAAALLHDLGHGPFSHLFEEVIPRAPHHEEWTQRLILDDATDVHSALQSLSRGMPERVSALLTHKAPRKYLSRALSGMLDVDRCDYLLRDSHMTGVGYGLYDLDWLLRALVFAQLPGSDWVMAIEGRKGLHPIESYFLARHFMYQQVYHHKATRAAECLIRAIFLRFAELVRDGDRSLDAPPALRKMVLGEKAALDEYAELDDFVLMTALAQWEKGRDAELAQLCKRFRGRELPKTIPLSEQSQAEPEWKDVFGKARDVAKARGLRPDFSVWLDVPSDVPYQEPANNPDEGLWVLLRHQPLQRLGDTSFLLGELRNKRISRPRLVFQPELRDQIGALFDGVTG